jgi:hypothetical protein
MKIAAIMALEQYFFWVCLMASTLRIVPVFFFILILHNFKDLPVTHIGSADNAQQDEDRYEYSPGAEPSIQIIAHEKAEHDAAGHGQAQLHDKGDILRPGAVLFEIEHA